MNSSKIITGYRLKHPNSNKHYIGITSQQCKDRLNQHVYSSEKNKKSSWIKSHADQRDLFYMESFFECTDFDKAKQLEIYWIARDRKTYGNERIGKLKSDTSRQRMSEAKKGKPSSRKGRPNLSEESNFKIAKSKAKLNKDQLLSIFKMLNMKIPYPKVAKYFNVTPSTICNIKKGKIKFYKIMQEKI